MKWRLSPLEGVLPGLGEHLSVLRGVLRWLYIGYIGPDVAIYTGNATVRAHLVTQIDVGTTWNVPLIAVLDVRVSVVGVSLSAASRSRTMPCGPVLWYTTCDGEPFQASPSPGSRHVSTKPTCEVGFAHEWYGAARRPRYLRFAWVS